MQIIQLKKETLSDHTFMIDKHVKQLEVLEEQISTKAKLGEFRALEMHTKTLPTSDQLEELKVKIYDSIADFKK